MVAPGILARVRGAVIAAALALSVLERTDRTIETVYPDKPARREQVWHFGCRGLKRWPLGTPYTTIVAEMGKLTAKPPLAKAKLVIDGTGVGRPVVDMFRKAQLPVTIVPVMITMPEPASR